MTIEEMNAIRDELGLSYSQIAEAGNLPPATVQKVLSGETARPRRLTKAALNEAMTQFKALLLSKDSGEVPYHPGYDTGQQSGKSTGNHTLKDYLCLPAGVRKELIDGTFYDMSSPSVLHQRVVMRLGAILDRHIREHQGSCTALIAPIDVLLDEDERTCLQPDVLVVCDPSKLRDNGIYGAPDLVVEVLSDSTRRKDIFLKSAKYESAGVREYWMIDPDGGRIVVCRFEEDDFQTIYGADTPVPVGIWEGELTICLSELL